MARMVDDAGPLPDHLRHPPQRPQIRAEPAGTGAGQQGLFDLGELLTGHPRGPAGRATAAQRGLAALLPAPIPAAHVLTADPQLAGDLGLGDPGGKQLRGTRADLVLGVTVAARAPTHPATARPGRHPPILADEHEHVARYREPGRCTVCAAQPWGRIASREDRGLEHVAGVLRSALDPGGTAWP